MLAIYLASFKVFCQLLGSLVFLCLVYRCIKLLPYMLLYWKEQKSFLSKYFSLCKMAEACQVFKLQLLFGAYLL